MTQTDIQKINKAPNTLIAAIQGNKIKTAGETVVRNKLKKIFVILGIPEGKFPIEQEITFIETQMRKLFGDLTIEELELAFELAVAGKIDFDLNLYDQPFNITYLGRLIKVYREYKSVHPDVVSPPKLPEHIPSKQEVYADFRQSFMEFFEQYKENPGAFDFKRELKWFYYDVLFKDRIEIATPEEKTEFLKIAEKQLASEERAARTGGHLNKISLKTITKPEQQQKMMIDRAKELLLKRYFENLLTQGLTIELPETI